MKILFSSIVIITSLLLTLASGQDPNAFSLLDAEEEIIGTTGYDLQTNGSSEQINRNEVRDY